MTHSQPAAACAIFRHHGGRTRTRRRRRGRRTRGPLRDAGAGRRGLPRPAPQPRHQARRARGVRHLPRQVQDEGRAQAPVPQDPVRPPRHVPRPRAPSGPTGPSPSPSSKAWASTRWSSPTAPRAPNTSASRASGSRASITPRTSSTTTTGCRPSPSVTSQWVAGSAIVGVGNVMVDIANYCAHYCDCDEIIAIARRGPFEKAYEDKEFEDVEDAFDRSLYRQEIERIGPRLEAAGQNPDDLLKALAAKPESRRAHARTAALPLSRVAQARRDGGRSRGRPRRRGEPARAQGRPDQRGRHRRDLAHSLRHRGVRGRRPGRRAIRPAVQGRPLPHRAERRPGSRRGLRGLGSREQAASCRGVFVVGWSRRASDGVVGRAKLDAETGIKHVLAWLQTKPKRAGCRSLSA